jgi:hypothetical protein
LHLIGMRVSPTGGISVTICVRSYPAREFA